MGLSTLALRALAGMLALAIAVTGCASTRPAGGPPATAPSGTVPTTSAPTSAPPTSPPVTSAPSSTAPLTTLPQATTTTAAPVTTTTPVNTTTPGSTVLPAATLSLGARGPAVTALQEQLTALGYWLGDADGYFGDATQQAVYALQKAAGIARDGVVGPVTSAALQQGTRPRASSTVGYVIEINLENQLLMFVRNGSVVHTLNTSTGGGYVYTADGVTSVANTPRGHFTVYRQVDGLDISPLGELWRPKYFYSGYAVHGYEYVPSVPVSHGCVRVSNEAMNWIWTAGLAPIGTAVWVY